MVGIARIIRTGECGLEDPYKDCDDFFSQWEGETDYICEDEERTAYLDERG